MSPTVVHYGSKWPTLVDLQGLSRIRSIVVARENTNNELRSDLFYLGGKIGGRFFLPREHLTSRSSINEIYLILVRIIKKGKKIIEIIDIL